MYRLTCRYGSLFSYLMSTQCFPLETKEIIAFAVQKAAAVQLPQATKFGPLIIFGVCLASVSKSAQMNEMCYH